MRQADEVAASRFSRNVAVASDIHVNQKNQNSQPAATIQHTTRMSHTSSTRNGGIGPSTKLSTTAPTAVSTPATRKIP
jgi:hypothetical protein